RISTPQVDLLEFATRFYGEKSFRRKDQIIRGTTKGLKTSFVVPFSETEGRLDPPYYFWRYQASGLLAGLTPLRSFIEESGERFKPTSDDELDREYAMVSVSSDGKVTLNEYVRGETFSTNYRPKRVHHNDFVYNPMRANIGSIGLVPKALDGCLASPDYVVFRCKKGNPNFLIHLLRTPFYRMYIDVVSTGSIRDRLYLRELMEMRVPNVSRSEQATISEIMRRTEEELLQLYDKAAGYRAAAVGRLHDLVEASGAMCEDRSDLRAAFSKLAAQWHRETGPFSSVSKKVKHPAYQAIIHMGKGAVPFILEELRVRPAHWFAALKEITNEEPPGLRSGSSFNTTAAAWLEWGLKRGYIK
ncbi:restriction endonuclease subunit S, partial [Rhodoplanes sp. SY1]|uniref:restriction endonuclease subunit S n=1 Tax=Rhodoplanes sp. SY1 TaxID=3166646 RepID=UPI0038B5A785